MVENTSRLLHYVTTSPAAQRPPVLGVCHQRGRCGKPAGIQRQWHLEKAGRGACGVTLINPQKTAQKMTYVFLSCPDGKIYGKVDPHEFQGDLLFMDLGMTRMIMDWKKSGV